MRADYFKNLDAAPEKNWRTAVEELKPIKTRKNCVVSAAE
jgi:hypothetical protein